MEQTNTTTPLTASSLTELQFNTLVAHSHDGIALLNAQGVISYVSPSVEHISGYTPDELTDKLKDGFIHPDDLPEYTNAVEKLVQNPGQTILLTYRFKHKNGLWNWAEAIATNSLAIEGINAIVFNFKNITERVLAQEKNRTEKLKRDALINNIADSVWSVDANLCLIDANATFLASANKITGRTIQSGDNLIYDNVDAQINTLWASLYKRGLQGEAFVYEGNYGILWFEASFSPIVDDGKITGVACISKNITKRKAEQEQLRTSENNMAIAQRIAKLGSWDIALTGADPFIQPAIWTNETYRILGYDKTVQPTLQLFVNRLHPDDKDYVLNALSTGIANNDTTPIEYRIICPPNEIKWLKTQGEIFYDDITGAPTRIVGTHKDITERKLLELEREKVVDDLTLRNKELEQFTYIVSHNLRGHVSNIIGMAAELAEPATQRDIHQLFLTEIKNSAQKLDTVIKDLSFILQHKRGAFEAKAYVNFAELVTDITNSLGSQITGHNVQIATHFEAEGINGIKSYLYSIFHNLITNSIKYHNPATTAHITIKSSLVNGQVQLVFADNGIGIDLTHNADKIFGLYRRFHTHTEGKGMGLYMVKNQVEQLGGTITLTSAVNQGTQFTILLPNS